MKQVTMVFPDGVDTLKTTEDMIEHYKNMGYTVEGEATNKKPASAPSVSEQNKKIRYYIKKLLRDDPDKTNEVNWTMDGVPDANVMSEALGFEVSATVRNRIWREENK